MTSIQNPTAWLDLPDSWYPVCRSEQLKSDRPLALRALGMDWVLFRSGAAVCSAVQRYCCHMGTDLAAGRVLDYQLRCPLHHWRFNGDGQCVAIPASQTIPKAAKLISRPCVEHFGMIFIGNGGDELFDFPSFNGMDSYAHSRAQVIPIPAPYETVSLNAFDVQHLTAVHQRELPHPAEIFCEAPSHLGIRYTAHNIHERIGNRLARWLRLPATDIRVDCWGGNLLLISIEGNRPNFVIALLPLDTKSSRLYLATVEGSPSEGKANGLGQRLKLAAAAALTRGFVAEDVRTLSGARPKMGALLPGVDVEAARFWSYWSELSRSGPRALP